MRDDNEDEPKKRRSPKKSANAPEAEEAAPWRPIRAPRAQGPGWTHQQ